MGGWPEQAGQSPASAALLLTASYRIGSCLVGTSRGKGILVDSNKFFSMLYSFVLMSVLFFKRHYENYDVYFGRIL